jgi:hypothetical protein
VSLSRSGASILAPPGVSALIWATGYRCDFSWIDLPVLDACGEPVHRGGITAVPGLYFLGLQWLSKMNSSTSPSVPPFQKKHEGARASSRHRSAEPWYKSPQGDPPCVGEEKPTPTKKGGERCSS